LRVRGSDILLLARHFIDSFCRENNLPVKRLTPEAQRKLLNYFYPGNVRELKSMIELAVTLSVSDNIDAGDFTITEGENAYGSAEDEMTMRQHEMRIIRSVLKKYNNDISLTAKKLDIGVSTIYRMLKNERESQD